ncbi:hypothetical protein TNCV_3837861 [Trichonephila clavipes]|nr:hypothetical protein TNCV_3837861 [Trichonephila clavipes]
MGGRLSSRQIQRASLLYTGVFSGTGFKLVTGQPRPDTLTTRLPRPPFWVRNWVSKLLAVIGAALESDTSSWGMY